MKKGKMTIYITLCVCFTAFAIATAVAICINHTGKKETALKTEIINVQQTALSGYDIAKVVNEINEIAKKSLESEDVSAMAKAIDPTRPMVALTFDDGPATKTTTRILDLVEKYNISVTFFVVGNNTYRSDIIKRAAKLGCEIGNHTVSHNLRFSTATQSQIENELKPVEDAVKKITGEKTYLVRPPEGAYSPHKVKAETHPYILWSVDTKDWQTRDKQKIFQEVKNNVFDGAIILMHDIYLSTADSCELIIPWLLENGYQLVTVSQMFYIRNIRLLPGCVYRMACKDGRYF